MQQEVLKISNATATHGRQPAGRMRQRAPAHRLRRYLVVPLLIALGVGAWIERVPLLRGAANLWVVSDPITPADAVVVLGGGVDVRPFAAADLYEKGVINRILVSRPRVSYCTFALLQRLRGRS